MNRYKIQHGKYFPYHNIGCQNRRSTNIIPMPLKLEQLLFKKARKFKTDVVEFTYGEIPDRNLSVITIVHPLDQFRKRTGYNIVMQRLTWAENEVKRGKSINHKNWAYVLER